MIKVNGITMTKTFKTIADGMNCGTKRMESKWDVARVKALLLSDLSINKVQRITLRIVQPRVNDFYYIQARLATKHEFATRSLY